MRHPPRVCQASTGPSGYPSAPLPPGHQRLDCIVCRHQDLTTDLSQFHPLTLLLSSTQYFSLKTVPTPWGLFLIGYFMDWEKPHPRWNRTVQRH